MKMSDVEQELERQGALLVRISDELNIISDVREGDWLPVGAPAWSWAALGVCGAGGCRHAMVTQGVGETPKVLCLVSHRDVLEPLWQCSCFEPARDSWPRFVGEVASDEEAEPAG